MSAGHFSQPAGLANILRRRSACSWAGFKQTSVRVQGANSGEAAVWSTSPAINDQFIDNFAPTSTEVGSDPTEPACKQERMRMGLTEWLFAAQVTSVDVNNDGKPDFITFSALIATPFPVHSVKLLLQFQYKLWVRTRRSWQQMRPAHFAAVRLQPLAQRAAPPRAQGALKLQLYGLAYVQHSSPVQGAALYTDGQVRFPQVPEAASVTSQVVWSDPG